MNAQAQTDLITLVILALVVGRFLVRELRARTVVIARLWIRPAVLSTLTLLLIAATMATQPASIDVLGAALAGGAVVGIIVGRLVAASTRVEPAGAPDRVRLHGSWVTVAIWVGALLLRMGVRFLAVSGDVSGSPAINSGTVLLVAVAFATFAFAIVPRAKAVARAGVSQ